MRKTTEIIQNREIANPAKSEIKRFHDTFVKEKVPEEIAKGLGPVGSFSNQHGNGVTWFQEHPDGHSVMSIVTREGVKHVFTRHPQKMNESPDTIFGTNPFRRAVQESHGIQGRMNYINGSEAVGARALAAHNAHLVHKGIDPKDQPVAYHGFRNNDPKDAYIVHSISPRGETITYHDEQGKIVQHYHDSMSESVKPKLKPTIEDHIEHVDKAAKTVDKERGSSSRMVGKTETRTYRNHKNVSVTQHISYLDHGEEESNRVGRPRYTRVLTQYHNGRFHRKILNGGASLDSFRARSAD